MEVRLRLQQWLWPLLPLLLHLAWLRWCCY